MASARASLQALCRATFSLCSAVSTSAAAGSAMGAAGGLRAAAAAAAGGGWGLQQHAAAAAGLRQLARVRAKQCSCAWLSGALSLCGLLPICRSLPPPAAATPTAAACLPPALPQHFHASLGARLAAEEGATPAINPLQQAPTPASPMGGPTDFGPGGGGDDGPATSRAVHRGVSISPQVRFLALCGGASGRGQLAWHGLSLAGGAAALRRAACMPALERQPCHARCRS